MKRLCKTTIIVASAAAMLQASGYKIPEQSLSAVALGAANVAAVDGSDASYYNPANMAFLTNQKSELELGLTYINLPSMKYKDDRLPTLNGKSKTEHFVAPYMHFVIPQYYENWRFGFSFVAPGGLAKRWETPYQMAQSKKFSLKIIEANPTAAYRVNDIFAIGFGARMVYTRGIVHSNAVAVPALGGQEVKLAGDSIDFGYNLALSLRPIEGLALAATYRSKVDLTVEGKAGISKHGKTKASVDVILPATLDLAIAYTFNKRTTVEFVYERVYWSKYKELDFESSIPLYQFRPNNKAISKNWKDSNTYRIGLTHWWSDNLKLMAGFTIDKTPAPDSSLGPELPDSDGKIYSGGFEYKLNDDMSVGLAYLYSDKEKRRVSNALNQGEFSNGGAHLVSASLKYRF
ncbi:MAG: OmpP1/FadL family transporter [Campylobacteraceae bacterium]